MKGSASNVAALAGTAARLLVGGVWIAAGLLKLPDPAQSVRAVRAYQLLPEGIVPTIGHGLPVLEVLVGSCLVLGLVTRPVAAVSAVMLSAFIVGIVSVWSRGISIDCGCFGGGGTSAGASSKYPLEIARDAGLLLCSAYLMWRPRTRWALDDLLFPPIDDVRGVREEPAR